MTQTNPCKESDWTTSASGWVPCCEPEIIPIPGSSSTPVPISNNPQSPASSSTPPGMACADASITPPWPGAKPLKDCLEIGATLNLFNQGVPGFPLVPLTNVAGATCVTATCSIDDFAPGWEQGTCCKAAPGQACAEGIKTLGAAKTACPTGYVAAKPKAISVPLGAAGSRTITWTPTCKNSTCTEADWYVCLSRLVPMQLFLRRPVSVATCPWSS